MYSIIFLGGHDNSIVYRDLTFYQTKKRYSMFHGHLNFSGNVKSDGNFIVDTLHIARNTYTN